MARAIVTSMVMQWQSKLIISRFGYRYLNCTLDMNLPNCYLSNSCCFVASFPSSNTHKGHPFLESFFFAKKTAFSLLLLVVSLFKDCVAIWLYIEDGETIFLQNGNEDPCTTLIRLCSKSKTTKK